jgi:putative membrane protein
MQHTLDARYKWYLLVTNLTLFLVTFLVVGSSLSLAVTEAAGAGAGVVIFVVLFMILLAIAGIVYLFSWLWVKNYHYELLEDSFKKQFGILTIRNTRIPYDRIQNIDIRRPLLMRIFGLSALHIQTAGGTSLGMMSSEGTLPGLRVDVAQHLQEELLKRAKAERAQLTKQNGL